MKPEKAGYKFAKYGDISLVCLIFLGFFGNVFETSSKIFKVKCIQTLVGTRDAKVASKQSI